MPTLYRADWVLPVCSPPIAMGAVLVGDDGKIAAVGPAAAVDAPSDAGVVDLGAAALLPGLINVHAHPELAMFRGALENLPFRGWILRLVGAKRACLEDEDFRAAARWTMIEAARAGITTLGATEASGAAAEALEESGLRGVVYQEVFGPAAAQVDESMAELRRAVDGLRETASDRVRIGISPHAPYTVSDALFQAAAGYAVDEGLPMAIHIAESAAERALVTAGEGDFAPGLQARGIDTPLRGRSPVELLAKLGVLEARPLLIHCRDVDDEDIRLIAGSGSSVAHCPVANAKLGHGIAPLLALRQGGVAVGLGTDSAASNNRMDLLEEARFAALLHSADARRADALTADDLLRLCTIDGARALGLESAVGTLEPGKEADLCAVSLKGPHVRPIHDPTVAIFHGARGSDVVMTVVQGKMVFRDGAMLTMDEEAIGGAVEAAAAKLRIPAE